MGVSILILTLDEEQNLPACLESVAWSDDIVVFDSFSSDTTARIARDAGARVFQREFDDFATQRSAALSQVEYKNPWVLIVDADERVPKDLRDEIDDKVASARPEMAAFRLRFKNFFYGKWLKYSSLYPTWIVRLVRVGSVSYENRLVNAHPLVSGETGQLEHHLHHFSYNVGMHRWFNTQNVHSTLEAVELQNNKRRTATGLSMFSRDPMQRRRALKNLAFRLPGRPFIVFCYMYFFRLGILEGRPGLTHCTLRAIYEYMIDVKNRELKRRQAGLSI